MAVAVNTVIKGVNTIIMAASTVMAVNTAIVIRNAINVAVNSVDVNIFSVDVWGKGDFVCFCLSTYVLLLTSYSKEFVSCTLINKCLTMPHGNYSHMHAYKILYFNSGATSIIFIILILSG